VTSVTASAWAEANHRWLVAALAELRSELERAHDGGSGEAGNASQSAAIEWPEDLAPPALETLCERLALSPFERSVLLLCAGVELDSMFGELVAALQSNPTRDRPTFGLALSVLQDAHWSALSPECPLRAWRIIEVGKGATLATGPLQLDERVLHHLCGVDYMDERLTGLVTPEPEPTELGESHCALAERLARTLLDGPVTGRTPSLQLLGRDRLGKRGVAAAACAALGLQLYRVSHRVLPSVATELTALATLWNREVLLGGVGLLVECDDLGAGDPGALDTVSRLVDQVEAPLVISTRERLPVGDGPAVYVDVPGADAQEQTADWNEALRELAPHLDGHMAPQVAALVSQFDLGGSAIRAAAVEVLTRVAARVDDLPDSPAETADLLGESLWDAARSQARPRLGELAERLRPLATWDDLVLPESETKLLHDIATQVRHRFTVNETWGFADKSARGLGISALFAGVSGTGKTMASEVLANELRLDLYRIDLSQVVSKYIGETEKNLRRVFDEAEEGGAILLFDEADALFGKRSEVKDSHDRYANIEIGYLLQRMEAYRGLAILTTNMKDALDAAFLRRLRFIVHFPFPGAEERQAIWRRTFPDATPTEDLDYARLAQLNMAGGSIRNIALHGAFLAARTGSAVTMAHLLEAAVTESAKLQRPLSPAEVQGWQ
jgi:MoxR-like ATPase